VAHHEIYKMKLGDEGPTSSTKLLSSALGIN